MSCKYWLLFGLLTVGAASTAACSSKFSGCQASRTCAPGGAGGTAGTAEAGEGGAEAGAADEGGSAGRGAQAGAGAGTAAGATGNADDAGSAGVAGEPSVDMELTIAEPTFAAGRTYVPFTGKLSASGAAQYSWSITSGALPAGLSLQGAQSTAVTIAGTPTEAGQFPITVSVTDGTSTKSVDVTLVVTHSALFLSDRNIAGVNELFIAQLGAATASTPVRVNASIPSGGGITSYAWSPDGSKVMYIATQSAGGAAELWVASLASPGTAQRVSAAGVTVSNIAWLLSGNIAAYNTSTGDAYLVDLSGGTAGVSKLVVSGPADPGSLDPSPNGLGVGVENSTLNGMARLYTANYVTWSEGSPKSVIVFENKPGGPLHFSFDGRFGFMNDDGGVHWWDLSLPSPASQYLDANGHSTWSTWSPTSQAVLFEGNTPSEGLYRGVFAGGNMTSTLVVQGGSCSLSPRLWSPDGRQALFSCDNDLRGIGSIMTAALAADFSVLPSDSSTAYPNVDSIGWSPDSKWIGYRASHGAQTPYDLYLIRWSAPGVAYKPHANSVNKGVATQVFAPDSQSVAFVGAIAPQSNAGLYLSKLRASGAPSTATLISSPTSAVVQSDINWLPGAHVIAYRATVAGADQLFAVPIAADGTAVSAVSVSGVSGGGGSSYQLAPVVE